MPDEPTPTSSTPATPATAAVAATTPPEKPATVTIPLDQLTAFTAMQVRLAHVEAEQAARDANARAEQVKVLAQKGDIEAAMRQQAEDANKALNTEKTQRAVSEERAKRYAVDAELAQALASQPLSDGSAEQLSDLWRGKLLAEPHGDSYAVRTPTFQSVKDFVAAQLAQPHYSKFLRSTNQGGAGATGGSLASPTPPANPKGEAEPKTMSDQIFQAWAKRPAATSTAGPGEDLDSTFGLRRKA